MPVFDPALHPLGTRSIATVTGLCLTLASSSTILIPRPVAAAPPADADAGTDTSDAETLFRNGQAKYETADYPGAIELWTQAYALVDPVPQNAGIKAVLLYNLAQAHVKAYELDDDRIHLKQAQQLLQSFEGSIEALYESEADREEERRKVAERMAEIDAMLAAADEPGPDPAPEPQPDPKPVREPDPEPDPSDAKPGKPLIIAGAVVAGVGVGFGGLGIAGAVLGNQANDISGLDPLDFDDREAQFDDGATANALALTGVIAGGILLPVGVALIAVGVTRNKKARSSGATAVVVPTFTTHSAGIALAGRF